MSTNITVSIGGTTKRIQEVDDCWVDQQLGRRQGEGQRVCVQVSIESHDAKMHLSTPACVVGYGGGRRPNALEGQIFHLWDKLKLNTEVFGPSNVTSFLREIKRLFRGS